MNLRYVAAFVLVLISVFGVPDPGTLSTEMPTVKVQEPSDAMKSIVKPVARVASKMSPIDRLWLQGIYASAAKVVAADGIVSPHQIETTSGVLAVHVAILKHIWRGMAENAPGTYEGLKEAIEQSFADTIGTDHRYLTPDLREKVVELFDAIAWAGLGKDG
jgi:hypothetical protein